MAFINHPPKNSPDVYMGTTVVVCLPRTQKKCFFTFFILNIQDSVQKLALTTLSNSAVIWLKSKAKMMILHFSKKMISCAVSSSLFLEERAWWWGSLYDTHMSSCDAHCIIVSINTHSFTLPPAVYKIVVQSFLVIFVMNECVLCVERTRSSRLRSSR